MAGTRKELAKAIVGLSFIEMREFGEQVICTVKTRNEDGSRIDLLNRDDFCDQLALWAQNYLEEDEE